MSLRKARALADLDQRSFYCHECTNVGEANYKRDGTKKSKSVSTEQVCH